MGEGSVDYPVKTFFKGTTIFKEGAEGETAYILLKGRVELSRKIRGERRHVVTISPTSIFGEMALILKNHRRLGTITALDDIQVVEVGREVMEDMLDNTPPILKAVLSTLVQRLRVSTCKLSYVPKLVHGAALILDTMAKNGMTRVDQESMLSALNGLYGNSREEGVHALDQLAECDLISMSRATDGGVAVYLDESAFFLQKALDCLGRPDDSVLAELLDHHDEYVARGMGGGSEGDSEGGRSFNVLDDEELPDMETIMGKISPPKDRQ